MVQTIPLNLTRNSNLIKLIKNNMLKSGESKIATLPNGKPVVGVAHVDKNAIRTFLDKNSSFNKEANECYLDTIPDNYNVIRKFSYNPKGHLITSEHEIFENRTQLSKITMQTPKGEIVQCYTQEGTPYGHIRTTNVNDIDISWDYKGNITNPRPRNLHEGPGDKTYQSLDAFRAAVDYIKGKCSLETYRNEMAK